MSEPSPRPPFRLIRSGGDVDSSRIFNVPGVVLAVTGAMIAIFAIMAILPERMALIIEFTAAVSPQRFLIGAERNGGWLNMLSPLIDRKSVV